MDTLSRYLSAYIIEFAVESVVIEKIGKRYRNAPFVTGFLHCVEVFEEMVNNWRM